MQIDFMAKRLIGRLKDEAINLITNEHVFNGYAHWMPIQAAWDSLDVSLTKWATFWYESF